MSTDARSALPVSVEASSELPLSARAPLSLDEMLAPPGAPAAIEPDPGLIAVATPGGIGAPGVAAPGGITTPGGIAAAGGITAPGVTAPGVATSVGIATPVDVTADASAMRLQPGPARDEIVKRLRRAEGQLRGIVRMLEEGQGCLAVAQQLTAVRRALDATTARLAVNYLEQEIGDRSRRDPGLLPAVEQVGRLISRLG